MAGRFLIKDIALQAGVGMATVDRVLNGRGGVRQQTVDRVRHAIRELDAQAGQLVLKGRQLIVDIVVEAPQTFLDALDTAIATEIPLMKPAVFRIRRDMRTQFPVSDLERLLLRIARRGSHGVILMAPEANRLKSAIDELAAGGIPVITLATDIEGTRRHGYVGLDNSRAGATAAWFIGKFLPAVPAPNILVTIRNERFRGEEEREAGFRAAISRDSPSARIECLVEGQDRAGFFANVRHAASQTPVHAVYSIGGSNRDVINAIEQVGQPRPLFIAHDLDPENDELLRDGKIDMVIYHDLREDVRNACRIVMASLDRGNVTPPPDHATLRIKAPPMVN